MTIEGKRNRSIARRSWNSIFLYIFFAFYMAQSLFYCAVSYETSTPVCSQSRAIGSRNKNGKSDRRPRNPSFSSPLHFTLYARWDEQTSNCNSKKRTRPKILRISLLTYNFCIYHQTIYVFLFTNKFKNILESSRKWYKIISNKYLS